MAHKRNIAYLVGLVVLVILAVSCNSKNNEPALTTEMETLTPTSADQDVTDFTQQLSMINLNNADQLTVIKQIGKGRILQVFFSPDGKQLVVITTTNIYIYDSPSLTEMQSYPIEIQVNCAALSQNGEVLSIGDLDGKILLLEVFTGTVKKSIETQSGEIDSLAFSPDGQVLASGSSDGTISLWNTTDGSQLLTLTGHEDFVSNLDFSKDGSNLLSGSHDGKVILWQVGDGTLIWSLMVDEDGIRELAFSPDGETILTYGNTEWEPLKIIRVWDGSLVKTIEWESGQRDGLSISNKKDVVAIRNYSDIELWQISDGTLLNELEGHTNFIHGVVFSPDGEYLASGSTDGTIRLWNTSDGSMVQSDSGFYSNYLSHIAFSPDSKILASDGDNYSIQLWQIADGSPLLSFGSGHYESKTFAFSPQGDLLASETQAGLVEAWSLIDGSLVQSWDFGSVDNGKDVLLFTPDGKEIIVNSNDGLKLLKITDGSINQSYTFAIERGPTDLGDGVILNNGGVFNADFRTDLVLSPDGSSFIFGDQFGEILRVQIMDGSWQKASQIETDIDTIAYSPNREFIAIGEETGSVKLLRAEDGIVMRRLSVSSDYDHRAVSLVFSQNSDLLIAGLIDGTVKIWDTTNGHQIIEYSAHAFGVETLIISQDGKMIATCSGDGTIRIWGIPE